MLREVFLRPAVEAWLAGDGSVRAIITEKDGEEHLIPLERLFNGVRFLVEEKAVKVNIDAEAVVRGMVNAAEKFEAAVQGMISEGCCESEADSDKALPESQPEPEEPSGGGIPRKARRRRCHWCQAQEGGHREAPGTTECRMEPEADRSGVWDQREYCFQAPEEAGGGRGREADCREREGR